MARYGTDYRDQLPQPSLKGIRRDSARLDYYRWAWQKNPPKALEKVWLGLFYGGLSIIVLLLLAALLHF
jgi:phycobilisome rod-core linker protein